MAPSSPPAAAELEPLAEAPSDSPVSEASGLTITPSPEPEAVPPSSSPSTPEAAATRAPFIHACIRVRPRMHDETGYIECHERVGNKLIAVSDYSDQFSSILGPQASQHDVFNTCGIQLLETALEGKDVCLFAYGQTGSGKTFSMYGAEGGKNPAKLDGVVPAMCAELFRRKQQMEKRHDVKLSLDASLVEVQGNKVIDLLADSMADGQQPALRLRGAEVQGEQRVKVHSSRWLTHLIERGMSKRVTTQNMTHAHSSRSHAFLTLIIEKRVHAHGEVAQIHKSTVYLVDLAGSERFVSGSQTSVGGGSINAGLLSLGKVLMALSQHSPHVPYRDSVLTRMLSNILGNDCLTYVLACVNPGFEQFSETRNVLQYAQRATAVMPKLGAEPHKSDSDSGYDTDGATAHDDPMAHDSFDVDESMDRRTEMIETVSFGDVFARCVGDPGNPLLLYVHGSGKGKRASSKMWNSLVTNVSRKMGEEAAAHAASASKTKGKKRDEQEPGSFKQKGKGKDGKDKRRSASDLKDDGADADEEDEAASSGYSLVYNLRSRLSLAIRGRKKELMQMSCSMCFSPLIAPARIVSCRHVLCEVCVEKTIFYFRDCPICERAMSDAAPIDVDHAEVMRVRLSSLSQPPPIVTTQKARLDSMARERERSNRAVLEFGSEGRALGGGKTEFTFFLRVVRSPDGAQVFRGAHCPISLEAYELIDHVTLHCGASKAEPAEGESGYQHARAHDYSVTTTARRCRITIHWAAAFRMAPLQVRYTASGAALFQRRIVVQLPPDVTSSSTKAIEHDDGGAPLVFGDDAGVSSGWVTYLPGLSGGRAQGTIHLSSRKVKEAMAALASSGLAWKWAERLAEETEEAVDEAIGQVRDVQHELVCGATKLTPLRELGKGAASDGSRKSKDLLLKSICNGMDPAIVETYETMLSMMHASSKSGGLSELFNEQTRAAAHPKNFYQVAIDLPGYGKTPPMSGGFCSPKFLSEVVRALAKLHAFAIVACGQAASSLLKAVVEIPKLTSFIIVVREPLIENIDLETLHGILHPTLAVCDMHSRLYPSVRQLSSVLPQITSPKFSLSTNPNFYQKEMANEMYKFMLDNGWHGSLPSTGNSMKLPLLTRLAGGIGAWKGDEQNEKATAPATATLTDPAATRSTPRKDHSSSTPSMPPAQPTSRSSVDKEPLPSTRRHERPSRSTSERPARSTSAADKDPLPSTRRLAERPSRSTSERPTRSIFGQHKTRGGITPRASADKGRRPSFSVPSTPTAESKAQWEAERPPLPSVSVPSTPKSSTSQKADNSVVPSTPKGSGNEVPVSARPSRSILDRLSAPKLRGGAALKSGNRP